MTKETILTDEEVREILCRAYNYPLHIHASDIRAWRAIEQAVLQSSEIQAWKRDAERLDWLADPNNSIGNVQLPTVCVERNPHSLRDAIEDAMEQQA